MPIKVEQLPGESIIVAATHEPFDPNQDVQAMFAEITRLRLTIQGNVALIIDFSDDPASFSQLVVGLAEASRAIQAGKAAGINRPPLTIFVGTSTMTELASQAMGQKQYGGVQGHLCATKDEAIALARTKLST